MNNPKACTVKIGFVPTFRGRFSDWCRNMYNENLKAFKKVTGMELILPPKTGGNTVSGRKGSPEAPNGCVHSLDDAQALARYFAAQNVDGIIICPLDFGDERSSAKVAELLKVPVMLYATREPPAANEPSMARLSDSYCGNLSIASALYRRKIPFHFAGIYFPHEPALQACVESFVSAVSAVAAMKNARIGQVGLRPASFETVAYDEIALVRKFGQNVIPWDLSALVRKVESYGPNDPRVKDTIKNIRRSVAEVTVPDEYLLKAAKVELALVEFFESQKLSALAVQCWPSIGALLGIELCAVYGRLTGRGVLTACETDVLGALSMLVQHRASLCRTLPHFIDWTIQHREKDNCFLAWHCGNAPVCLAADSRKTALRSRGDMTGKHPQKYWNGGLFQFQLKPGPVTFCRLAEYDNQWKMLIANGTIIPSNETLAGTWSWVEVADHAKLYRTLVEEGFIHHASMVHGDQKQELLQVCKFLDIKPVVVE